MKGTEFMRVLTVVDMQNDFITGTLGNKECQAVVGNVVNVINTGNYDKIIATRDTHFEGYLNTQEGKKLPVEHCIINTEGWEIQKDVEAALEAYKDKITFGSTELSEIIKELGTENEELTVDFVGVCTGICIISNAIISKAFAPGADIRVIESACACVTPDSHKNAIEAMKLCQIDII
mgnify:FL=1